MSQMTSCAGVHHPLKTNETTPSISAPSPPLPFRQPTFSLSIRWPTTGYMTSSTSVVILKHFKYIFVHDKPNAAVF